jgi:hypothetical protein
MPSGRCGGALMLISFCLAGLCLFFPGCEDEGVKRDYPRVRTLEVTNITAEGARFEAEIFEPGSGEINDHGFVWSVGQPNIQNSNKVSLGEFNGTGRYMADIRSTLNDGFTYKVCAFVRSGDYTVYGIPVEFTSLGSNGPIISGFEPNRVLCGDTVLIRGRNFSWVKTFNSVYFNDLKGTICDPVTDTAIYVIVPFSTTEPEKTISAEVAGNRTTYHEKKLNVDLPSVKMTNPYSGRWEDTVKLTLKNLKSLTGMKVYLGTVLVNPLDNPDIGVVKFIVPADLSSSVNPVKVSVEGGDLFTEFPFLLLPPEIDSITPSTGVWSNIVTLYGKFNALVQDAAVSFGPYPASVSYISRDSINVTVPIGLNIALTDLVYSYKTLKSNAVQFKLRPPEIVSVTPESGSAGTVIKIRCKNVRKNFLSVRLGDTEIGCDVLTGPTYEDITIDTKVRGSITGSFPISISACGQSDTLEHLFQVNNPYVLSFSPRTAVAGDTVSIVAENFGDPYTSFSFATLNNGYKMSVVSSEGNVYKAVFPSCGTPSGPIYAVRSQNNVTSAIASDDIMAQTLPQILSVEPLQAAYGEEISVRGLNFSKVRQYNHLLYGGQERQLTSSSTTELRFKMPNLIYGAYNIEVRVGAYLATSQEVVSIITPWAKLPDLSFPNDASFAMNFGDEVLVATSLTDDWSKKAIFRFDSVSGTFSRINDVEYTLPYFWPAAVVRGDVAYLFGTADKSALYSFNRLTEEMKPVCDYPGRILKDPILMDGDSVLYMSGGYDGSRFTLEFWKYNYSKGVWTRLRDLPGGTGHTNVFSIDGRCYVVTEDRFLFEYNPADDTWIQRADYPGFWCRYKVSTVAEGKAYMGFGVMMTHFFHRYDPLADSWELIPALSRTYYNRCINFSFNNKVYLSGIDSSFWSYDPAREL